MVGDYLFEFTAGGFFQNNNTLLPLLVDYLRGLIDSVKDIPLTWLTRIADPSSDKLSFLSGNAANIFDAVKDFPSNLTVVVDPPRKECDKQF